MAEIYVDVVKLPGVQKRVGLLPGESTVSKALQLAEITLESTSEIKVDGNVASTSTVLTGGETVSVSPKIKGALS